MNTKLLFTPIFKSKFSSEPEVIHNCKNLFNKYVIPYIEIINRIDSKGYKKISNELIDIKHFEQIYRTLDSDLSTIIETSKILIKNNVIPSLHFVKNDIFKHKLCDLNDFILICHKNNTNCAIRIDLGIDTDEIISISTKLNKNDYIIIDIDENNYAASSFYLDDINSVKKNCQLIIFSNERPKKLSNTNLKENSYNNCFNTSLIEAIKNNEFIGNGFGSYCSAKNDTIESIPNRNIVFGVFLIFNFKNNNFFSLKTKYRDHSSRIYGVFKDYLLNDDYTKKIINNMFLDTPISKSMIDSFAISNKKGNASKYIVFSLVHYIEEIVNNIFN